MDELRDIKPLEALTSGLPWWLSAALAAVLLLAAGGVLVKRRSARRRTKTVPPGPTELALRALDAVRGSEPRDVASAEALQAHVAHVLRRWLAGRFEVQAVEMTTEELERLPRLADLLGQEPRDALIALLRRADDVRFGKHEIEIHVHRAAVEEARALVQGARA